MDAFFSVSAFPSPVLHPARSSRQACLIASLCGFFVTPSGSHILSHFAQACCGICFPIANTSLLSRNSTVCAGAITVALANYNGDASVAQEQVGGVR